MSSQATIKRSKNGIIKGIYNDTRGDVNRPICGVRGLWGLLLSGWSSGCGRIADVAASKLAPKSVFPPRAVRLAKWRSFKWHAAGVDGIRMDIPSYKQIILTFNRNKTFHCCICVSWKTDDKRGIRINKILSNNTGCEKKDRKVTTLLNMHYTEFILCMIFVIILFIYSLKSLLYTGITNHQSKIPSKSCKPKSSF